MVGSRYFLELFKRAVLEKQLYNFYLNITEIIHAERRFSSESKLLAKVKMWLWLFRTRSTCLHSFELRFVF